MIPARAVPEKSIRNVTVETSEHNICKRGERIMPVGVIIALAVFAGMALVGVLAAVISAVATSAFNEVPDSRDE